MKNTNMLAILSVVTFFSASLTASSAPTGSFDPVIELYNKGNESLQVNIIDISGSSQKNITTAYPAADSQWNSGSRVIDMNNPLLIEILKQNKLIARFKINAPGKTKYLSIDLNKTPMVYPQTGPLFGLMGKTKSGLPIKNNVSSSQITQVK